MRDPNHANFSQRLKRIDRRHEKLARGYVTVINSDGLMVAQPRRSNLRFPWKAAALVVLLLFTFKGLVLANLGAERYAESVISLENGTPVEQVGGWVMQADPLTVWIAGRLEPLL